MITQDNSLDIWNAIIEQNFSNIDNNINPEHVKALASKITKECKYITTKELREIKNIDRLKNVFNYLNKPHNMYNFFNNAIKYNEITIPSPFNTISLKSKTTFLVNKTIFIPFYDNNELFFIIQNRYYISAFYFPKLNIIYFPYNTDLNKSFLENFIIKSILNYKYLYPEALQKSKNFLGVIVSHDRPYHYFYDKVSSLEILNQDNLLKKIKNFYFFENEKYLKLEDFFQNIKDTEIINSNRFINQNNFVLMVGTNVNMLTTDQLESINNRINTQVYKSLNSLFLNLVIKNKDKFPIVWIGVTGQKRSWVEQEKGYSLIINKLYKKYPNLLILFDGWTTSEEILNNKSLNRIDKENIDKDNMIVKGIISRIDSKIKTINLIGTTPSEKLFFAQHITFYISNNGTGSIYVSRFANKPGITHNSIIFKKPSNLYHIHSYNRIEIDKKHITDIETDSVHVHFGDYSIEWQVIWEYTKNLIIKIEKEV